VQDRQRQTGLPIARGRWSAGDRAGTFASVRSLFVSDRRNRCPR
jgi:hypothetical protein